MAHRGLGVGRLSDRLAIAMLGTRGVPANYGGFETCADEVARGLVARGHAVTVYCRRGNAPGDPPEYEGVALRYTGHLDRKALGTLTHTLTATLDALGGGGGRGFDVLLYFNAANAVAALIAKLYAQIPVVLNVDGLEWKRGKWGAAGKLYYQGAEWLSTKVADRVVTDSRQIQAYYERRWKAASTFIPYGAHLDGPETPELLAEYGLRPGEYFLTVTRLEPENNPDLTVAAFAQVATDKKLVIVGGGSYGSAFARRLEETTDARVLFPGPVHEPNRIRELYCGAFAYVHGNEVGGTNPALLQAMGRGNCVLALDVPFNAETVADSAVLYRKDPADLAEKMRLVLGDPALADRLRVRARARAGSVYRWSDVVDGYERVLRLAAAGAYRGQAPSEPVVPETE